jgi:hypothetical protein
MTGSDLILLAPWIAFGVGLAVVVLRLHLLRRRRQSASPPTRPSRQELRNTGDRR